MAILNADQSFVDLLEYLKFNRGFDFTGYKQASLMRRIESRMKAISVATFADYLDYLEVHPEEFSNLFNAILINVTAFFRDPTAWEYVRDEIIPRIVQAHEPDEPLRIWSAGCASGEEAYTLAILFAEVLGVEAFRERVKIYATDIDEEALTQARQANYSPRQVSGVPLPLLEKYFEPVGGRYNVHKELRRAVIFGRHDVLQDAPISRIDLLLCRNTLMYFNTETQINALARFNFALNDTGFLFLGKAEMLFTHANLFVPLDLKRRIFIPVLKGTNRERLLVVTSPPTIGALPAGGGSLARMREQLFNTGPVAQIVVEANGTLALANERARQIFHIGPRDAGRALQDLELSYRPVELRSRIDQAYAEQRTVEIKEVLTVGGGGESYFLDVQVTPLSDGNGQALGVSITFTDVTRYKRLQQQLEETNHDLETAYEELQSTNEELETTNEELQSTVEELETTNEELQSTNEELETMNEELQSTNEELQSLNEELQTRSNELNTVNAYMNSILTSLRGSVIVLDREMQVQVWNLQSEEFWGLRADEVRNRHFLNLDIGLPVEEMKGPIRASLSGSPPAPSTIIEATNRRGRAITCRATYTPLLGAGQEIIGVIVLIEEMSLPTDVK